MKVAIIGCAGKVGAASAFALQLSGVARELAMIDVMADAAQGETLDLLHGAPLCGPLDIRAGSYDLAAGSDVVVITAGLRRKPDETRLQLVGRNVALFKDILRHVAGVPLAPDATLVVVANPVDILTRLAIEAGWAPARVIGTGTFLDTVRLRALLAVRLGCDPRAVEISILGEHGDSMVPIWSSAVVGAVPLASYPGFDPAVGQEAFQAAKKSGAEMIRLKQGAAYAIGLCVRDVVRAIVADEKRPLPVSTLQSGACGITGVCLSLPTIVGRGGVEAVLTPALAADELAALQASAEVLRESLAGLG